ncbi:terminase small subunit [Alkalicella caledoniensis]|uniref:Terminase small subunit n=1 Tax=Alkalicella caledoniensis TaxID=2731377 RepID=A0A7G9W8C2_ALKCA|nr:terminase small subunit [Alkalicella caledoniensis]QNO14934.1 terminase small subunit [Alkalicella caledoniensis]
MPRNRSPNRDKAFQLWKKSNGERQLKDIAAELGIKDSQVRKWKSQDKWEDNAAADTLPKQETKSNVTKKKHREKEKVILKELEEAELTEMQRLFCLYYIKDFNATNAATKAGYSKGSAHVEGSRLLRNPKVAAEIRRLKGTLHQEIFIDAMDVLNQYIKIAFANIDNYVDFGSIDLFQLDGNGYICYGPDGKPLTKSESYITVKNSDEVDGSLISEIKQGRNGIAIKLHDKMKALEKLAQYFDLLPDNFKRQIEEERNKMAQQKIELEKERLEHTKEMDKSKVW